MDARRRKILTACLRRVDGGEPLETVVRTSPEDADWLQDHLLFSEALRAAGGSSAKNMGRARESMLSCLAQSAPPSRLRTRRRLAFAIAQTALIIFGCLALTAGAAAASGVNLRSVPRQVVDKLVEPLPLSAETLYGSGELEQEERGASDNLSAIWRPVDPSGDGSAVVDDAIVPPGSPEEGGPNDTNPPTQGGPPTRTNPPASDTPDNNPQENNGTPPDNGGDLRDDSQRGDHCNDPRTTDPPGQNPSHSGQPGTDGHNGSNCPGNQGDRNQHGQTDSNGNGSNGEQPNGSNGDAPNGSNDGASSGANGDASNKASTHH